MPMPHEGPLGERWTFTGGVVRVDIPIGEEHVTVTLANREIADVHAWLGVVVAELLGVGPLAPVRLVRAGDVEQLPAEQPPTPAVGTPLAPGEPR